MKRRTRKLSLRKETLRSLTETSLRRAAGALTDTDTDTIIDTQDSICGCAGQTQGCGFPTNPCATASDPGCGPSCELVVC